MPDKAILSIDQGTTSTRAILYSSEFEILSVAQKELDLICPQKGWVEQNPEQIWQDTQSVVQDILKQSGDLQVASIGITNQRETTILWDRKTGQPVYNAIVWQDRRTADFCEALKAKGHEKTITDKTGLLLDPYFSATKIAWILENVEGAREKAEQGDLCFGTIDTYLIWKLTGGKSHKTDVTNASRTMLFNIKTQEWDSDLLKLFNIPGSILPEVCSCVDDFGVMEGTSISIGGVAGDQQAALIGQACFTPGMIKSTYGTGCFALMNIGEDFKISQNRLLTTIGYKIADLTHYALEGSIFSAGSTIQWLRDNLGLFEDAADTEALALSVPDSNKVIFIPAFTGMGAPYWKADAMASITGISRETNKAHITRAALEAQAFQTKDLFDAMVKDSGQSFESLRIDGGMVHNKFFCQFLADMLRCDVQVTKNAEATAQGAAYLAGLSCGLLADFDAISAKWHAAAMYKPEMPKAQQEEHYNRWLEAVQKHL